MCAAVGFPVLRLVRYAIEALTIEEIELGKVKPLVYDELTRLLKLN